MQRLLTLILGLGALCSLQAASRIQDRADRFLAVVNAGYQSLYRVQQEAQWLADTDVKPAHDAGAEVAGRAYAAFNGNPAIINEARDLLKHRKELTDLQVRQLERALLNAAEGPMTNPELVGRRIAAETAQASTLNGFQFQLGGTNVVANDLDRVLNSSDSLADRQLAWEAAKQTGPALKPGLVKLQGLRNAVARELGHSNYFALQVAGYEMSADEMLKLNDSFLRDIRPLYLQLHTWTKYKLAAKYHQPVPKRIPAHWINNRWAQEWDGLVEAASLDRYFTNRTPESIVKNAEQFYVGLGFQPLPASFWEKSDLYPAPKGSGRLKNSHASCWHVDLDHDVRSLMSVESTPWWFFTAHHELGHGYYFLSYTRPEVPALLRTGANPAFHEGIGEQISLAAGQVPYLKSVGVLPADYQEDQVATLLQTALAQAIPFMFFASGTMTHWEHDLYVKDLPADQYNARWWQYVADFQGVEPPGGPGSRGEEFCDAATKTHINDTPAYYYSYAIATVQKFQIHDYIARHILHQPPQSCNYANNREVGDFLKKFLRVGATQDWRKLLRETTGEDLSTRAMRDYFAPLQAWLEKENAGRPIGWE
ncbi:MAG TPA: M2 family metallopeptidase [Candidatus Limnocylindria bacterium]|nr:M2 family metallopeptidase [Candidatus Limnocylindria bacterium]